MVQGIELTFLGTGSAVPLPTRMHPGIHIKYGKNGFLFDCGEATQVQMKKAKISAVKISHIFITHWHGDHFLGLPGLIQSMNLENRTTPLTVFGPEGIYDISEKIQGLGEYSENYEVIWKQVSKGVMLENNDAIVSAFPVEHGVPAFGYIFQEKPKRNLDEEKLKSLGVPQGPLWGELQKSNDVNWKGKIISPDDVSKQVVSRKIVYTGDTRPCESTIKAAENADILIHDSTFSNDVMDRAKETGHSTAKEAAEIAMEAGVKQLVLTGFSKRYKDEELNKLWEEAKRVFDNVVIARDLDKITI